MIQLAPPGPHLGSGRVVIVWDSTGGALEAEFGDVLFSLVNYARFVDINPEDALERTNKKFRKRFQYLEKEAAKAGKKLDEMTLAEMQKLDSNSPCLLLVLAKQDSDTRWVVTALP